MRINSFYTEGTKIVREELFVTIAKEIAGSFVGKDKFNHQLYGVGRTQLRRLYDEVKRFEQILDVKPDAWEESKSYIRMVKSKLSYNITKAIERNRSRDDVYKNLSAFIAEGIDLSTDKEAFCVFASLFEAVYGFYYEKSQKFERGN